MCIEDIVCNVSVILLDTVYTYLSIYKPNINSWSLSSMVIYKKNYCSGSLTLPLSIVNIKAVLWDINQFLITNDQ